MSDVARRNLSPSSPGVGLRRHQSTTLRTIHRPAGDGAPVNGLMPHTNANRYASGIMQCDFGNGPSPDPEPFQRGCPARNPSAS